MNVYCYYASWGAERPDHAKVAGDDLDPNLCTHIFYAFLSLEQENDGKLSYLDEDLDVKQGKNQPSIQIIMEFYLNPA